MIRKTAYFFAHPDDELICTGALMRDIREKVVITVTAGEAGRRQNSAKLDPRALDIIRKEEYDQVCDALGITGIMLNFPDGQSEKWRLLGIEDTLTQLVRKHEFTEIVTFDASGGSGHPDHIMISEIATQIACKESIKLTYVTKLPRERLKKKYCFLGKKRLHKVTMSEKDIDHVLILNKKERQKKFELVTLYKSQFPDHKNRYYYMPKWLAKGVLGYECYNDIEKRTNE